MLELGKIYRGMVTRTEDYGIYLECDRDLVLVLIPYLSWTSKFRSGRDFTKAGEVHDVLVQRVIDSDKSYCGSIRDAHPERDPWRHIPLFPIGRIIDANVAFVFRSADDPQSILGYLVSLPNDLEGFLQAKPTMPRYQHGITIPVRIAQIDASRREIVVECAGTEKGRQRGDGKGGTGDAGEAKVGEE